MTDARPLGAPSRAALGRPLRWLARRWRGSLRFRAVSMALALSGVAITATGVYISYSVGQDLFESKVDQILIESERATTAAQQLFSSSQTSGETSVGLLVNQVNTAVAPRTSTRLISVLPIAGVGGSTASLQGFDSPGLAGGVISQELIDQVSDGDVDQASWQSVALASGTGSPVPGVVAGTSLTIPNVGRYGLYLGYDLSAEQSTLSFVQQILWLAGFLLMAMIAFIAWFVVRIVVEPLRAVAVTSAKLANGQLDERMPEYGDDVSATLAKSFNGMAVTLQSQITQLAHVSQVQQRFVSDVSHELRTPLTTIRLASDVLYDARSGFDPVSERTVELLHAEAQRFEVLLADLLEISRFDAGSEDMTLTPTNLAQLVENTAGQVRSLADRMGTDIIVEALGGYAEIDVDPRRIRRILRNLLGNAIEHGDGKPVVVWVDSNESAISIAVRDYGIGISQENLGRVFERFWRADPSRKRTIGGSGLGLAISLEDAQLHGGQLDLWSEPGKGSCFRLSLPRKFGSPVLIPPLPLPPDDTLIDWSEVGVDSPLQVADEGAAIDPDSVVSAPQDSYRDDRAQARDESRREGGSDA